MSITAARLQAEVGADTKDFDKGMAHADSTIAKAPSKWGRALKLGAGVGLGLAAGVAVKGLVGAISAGVESLKQQGVVVAQTNAVIKSTAGAAHVSADAVRDLSNAVEDKTAIDDKQVQAGANMLLTFTNIRNEVGKGNDIFNQSVGILADMSTAMGTDMKSGAIQLGKALNDPLKGITALTRVGVTFSDQQKEQIKNFQEAGDVASAQKVILAELNKEFGGSGAAFAATDAGKAAKFQDAIEGIQQSVAKGLLPAITRVRGELTNFLDDPATMGQAEALGNAIAGIFSEGNLRTAAGLMTTAAGAVSTAIKLFSGLPKEVQALAVGAIALKKITGIGPLDIAKAAGGVVSFVFERGATPANPLWVASATGAVGGVPGAAAAGGGALATVGAIAAPVLSVAAVGAVAKIIQDRVDAQGAGLVSQAGGFAPKATDAELANSIKGLEDQLGSMAFNTFDSKNKIVATLNVLIAEQNARAIQTEQTIAAAAVHTTERNEALMTPIKAAIIAADAHEKTAIERAAAAQTAATGRLAADTRSEGLRISGAVRGAAAPVVAGVRALAGDTRSEGIRIAAAAKAGGAMSAAAIRAKRWHITNNFTALSTNIVHVGNYETSKSKTTAKLRGNVYIE